MLPNSASPVLKTNITISLDPAFPFTLSDPQDFSVTAISLTKPDYIRYMNCWKVDDSKKQITTMFGGAYSGKFQISIRHKEYGLVDTNNMILDVSSKIQSISPQVGSVHGGTLVTIKGTNFGT